MSEVDPVIRTFFNQKPADVIQFRTVEIYHSEIGNMRFVSSWADQDFMIEAGAPRDAGTIQAFTALQLEWANPNQNDTGDITIPVNLGLIGSEVRSELKKIRDYGYMESIEVVLRYYLSSDTSGPKKFYYLTGDQVTLRGLESTIQASDDNPTNERTARVYTFNEFPGLEAV